MSKKGTIETPTAPKLAGALDVLVLTGTGGVGKSTVARSWAALRDGAAVHCDEIREWIRPRELRRAAMYQEQYIARVAATAAGELLNLGLHVAIDNVWTPSGILALREALAGRARLRFVWLACDRIENHRRDGLRAGRDVMGARVDELMHELTAMSWPPDLVRIDTTAQTIEESVQAIDRLFLG